MATKPIAFDSPQILALPKYCVCCGESTPRAITVKPVEVRTLSGQLFDSCVSIAFHPAHLASGIALLSRPNAKIPMCGRCRWNHFLPNLEVSGWIAFIAASLGGAFYFGFREQYGVLLAGIFAGVVGLVMLAWRGKAKDSKTLPLQVFYLNPGYRYVILSGPLHDFFSGHIQAEPPPIKKT